jgi:NADH-quinone oxidoreductase subunit I
MKEYLLNIWKAFSTIFIGMKVTFKHLFVPAVTIQYPDVKLELPERERNRLYVNMDDCIGCDQCAVHARLTVLQLKRLKLCRPKIWAKHPTGKRKHFG